MYDVLKRAICSFHRMDIKKKCFYRFFAWVFFVFICDVQYWFNARLFGGSGVPRVSYDPWGVASSGGACDGVVGRGRS